MSKMIFTRSFLAHFLQSNSVVEQRSMNSRSGLILIRMNEFVFVGFFILRSIGGFSND